MLNADLCYRIGCALVDPDFAGGPEVDELVFFKPGIPKWGRGRKRSVAVHASVNLRELGLSVWNPRFVTAAVGWIVECAHAVRARRCVVGFYNLEDDDCGFEIPLDADSLRQTSLSEHFSLSFSSLIGGTPVRLRGLMDAGLSDACLGRRVTGSRQKHTTASRVLTAVHRGGDYGADLTVKEWALALKCSTSSVKRAVETLEKEGLIVEGGSSIRLSPKAEQLISARGPGSPESGV